MATGILAAADAAVLETFVVPRYLALFADPLVEVMLPAQGAKVMHLGCRTGYPDVHVARRMPGASMVGVDPSPDAVELSRVKAQTVTDASVDYVVSNGMPTPYASQSFSHALTVHPLAPVPEDRALLFAEMSRLVAPSGQVLIALPLRGSFQELLDLLREHALKHDAGDVGRAAEAAAAMRPNVETLGEELEAAGLEDVDISLRRATVEFQSGRDFFEDPIARLLVLPDLSAHLPGVDLAAPWRYVRDAIDRYWADDRFELSVTVGVASARRY
jgi:ubiquinone/menaquinone biosynthesis C-methylase UbiE